VEITCCRAVFADADVATVKTTSPDAARTAVRRKPAPNDAWRDAPCHKETLTRTGADGIRGVGYPAQTLTDA
jgi:hypothetical protein